MNDCFSIIFKGECEKLEENLAKREKQMSLSLAIMLRNPISFSHSPLKIILKQSFTSGPVNIAEYLLRLGLGEYSAIFTSPSANNC